MKMKTLWCRHIWQELDDYTRYADDLELPMLVVFYRCIRCGRFKR